MFQTYIEWRKSLALTGTVVKLLSVAMLIPVIVGIVYAEDVLVFVASIVILIMVGVGLERLDPGGDLGAREAILFVVLAWTGVSVIGAVPYLIAGSGTESTLADPVNALFESTSGFTTTGATVMGEISVAQHSHALLIWRQLTQWLGGMGIIVLMIAILPEVAVNGAQLMESEAPGPELQKLTPKIAETARVLWLVYVFFTLLFVLVMVILHYSGLAPEMDLYNAVAHSFSTLPTGGFSPHADSIGAFGPIVQWAFIPFLLIAGMNFALFWHVLNGRPMGLLKNRELQTYLGAAFAIAAVLAGLLYLGAAPMTRIGGATAGVVENALRQGAFQIGSLMNSTGFATADFAQWDTAAQIVILFAMFVGGSAGSTGGGVKVVRWLVVVKAMRRELFTTTHPEAIRPIRIGSNVVDEGAVRGVIAFTLMYITLFGVAAVLIAIDASRIGMGLSALEAVSASLATIGNIGPGFGQLGPFGSYLGFPDTSKLLMILLMWIGRLEIIPVMVLFTGAFWRS